MSFANRFALLDRPMKPRKKRHNTSRNNTLKKKGIAQMLADIANSEMDAESGVEEYEGDDEKEGEGWVVQKVNAIVMTVK